MRCSRSAPLPSPAVSLVSLLLAGASLLLSGCDDTPPTGPASRGAGTPRLNVASAAQSGIWSEPFSWPIVAAHVSVLPTGRVISWVSSDVPGDMEQHFVHVWDPASGLFTDVSHGTHNVFCAGHTFLADGRLLVGGGHIENNKGLKQTRVFNAATNVWEPAADMRAGRWYPTLTTLVNGQVVVVAGADEIASGNPFPERWNGSEWQVLDGAPLNMPYYPWMYPAPDGRLFYAGPEPVSRYLNPSGSGEWTVAARSSGGFRDYGGSVMYAPGKILMMGGGDPPTNSAETIDLNTGGGWQPTGAMQYPRRQMNATVLPDGRVLAIGGTRGAGFNNESQPVLAAEVWNPESGSWTTLASMRVPRLYHSAAVLLPDARVLMAGGGRCGGACTIDHRDAEIFSPPYLFAADGSPASRPSITSAPVSVAYGQSFTVGTPDAASITRVTWVRLPATTHSFNQNQWFNELSFGGRPDGLTVTAPANAYLAPPGHYMLFVLNASGVPSVASIVQLTGSAALPPPPSAPTAPDALTATSPNDQQITLSWDDSSTNEAGFHVERCQGTGCSNFALIAQIGANITRYADIGLSTGITYGYRMRAENSSGFSGYSNRVNAAVNTDAALQGGPVTHRPSNRCMEVAGGSQAAGTAVAIRDCAAGAANQQWALPAAGTAGTIKAYGLMCLDAASGRGNDGDAIIIWECNGQVNQRWTLTTAGEWRGINGKCIDVSGGATANGTRLLLATCTDAPSQTWSVGVKGDQPPVAQFTYGCTDLNCSFESGTSSDDGGIASRAWNFGDGDSVGDVVSPLKLYEASGTYSVTLTVTDVAGQSSSQTQRVTVTAAPAPNQAPVVSFTSSCMRLTCTFTDASTDGDGAVVGWNWTFGDGGTAVTRNPSHSYATGGTYTVTLTATDDEGATNVATRSVTVSTGGTLFAGAIGHQLSGRCMDVTDGNQAAGTTVAIRDCAGTTNQRWAHPPAGTAGTITVYDFCLDAASGRGNDGDAIIIWYCNGQNNQRWTLTAAGELQGINGKCISLSGGATTNGTLLLLGPCTGASGQQWEFGSGGDQLPVAQFTARCTNLTCTFDSSGSTDDTGIASRSWTFGDGTTAGNVVAPVKSYTAAGIYPVTLTVRDLAGQSSSQTQRITAASSSSSGVLVAHRPSSRCMEVVGGSQAAGTAVAIRDCAAGAANQQWALPAAGTAGTIKAYGLMCLDAASGRGNDGDAIIIWECNGQVNQRWTLTTAGEWRGINGKCIDVSEGATANGTRLLLATCTGAPRQQWDVGSN